MVSRLFPSSVTMTDICSSGGKLEAGVHETNHDSHDVSIVAAYKIRRRGSEEILLTS
jgi:hypothetical protein